MAGVTLGILGCYCGLDSGIAAGVAVVTAHGCTIDNPSFINMFNLDVAIVAGCATDIGLDGKDLCGIVGCCGIRNSRMNRYLITVSVIMTKTAVIST